MMVSLVILVPWSQSKCFCFDIFALLTHGLGFLWLRQEEQEEMARMPALRSGLRNLVIVMQLPIILSGTR